MHAPLLQVSIACKGLGHAGRSCSARCLLLFPNYDTQAGLTCTDVHQVRLFLILRDGCTTKALYGWKRLRMREVLRFSASFLLSRAGAVHAGGSSKIWMCVCNRTRGTLRSRLKNGAGDHFFHDFVRTAKDALYAAVDKGTGDGVFHHVAVTAVELDAFIDHFA